uniref:WW domain-binding protein 2-like n=1 Tax=Ciona intestinalis TaxID=7719 RepID=F6U930_CIOIN|nr:WW domain-binding protein 2-like [Ciona intestinalis]|eukprot:XP_009857700.1 WW domain-binding protein 2-like [Ciona intestinalis]
MSFNKHMGPGLALFQGEMILMDHENVEMVLKKFSHSCEHLKGQKIGHVYLTNFRLLFVSSKSNDMLRELSMPFKNIKDFEIKQPVFGANYLQGKLNAEPDGGWQGFGIFEMTFKSGGAIEVGQKLVKLATNPPQMMYPAPPVMVYPTASIPGYQVPGSTNAYAFPAQASAPPPPMYQPQAGAYQPPPYPQQAPYPPQSSQQAKAMEAQQSTLPPQYTEQQQAPPKYDEAMKKDQ